MDDFEKISGKIARPPGREHNRHYISSVEIAAVNQILTKRCPARRSKRRAEKTAFTSKNNFHSIRRRFQIDGFKPAENIFAHVGQDEAPAAKFFPLFFQNLIIQMVIDLPLEEITLTDEEVGIPGHRD